MTGVSPGQVAVVSGPPISWLVRVSYHCRKGRENDEQGECDGPSAELSLASQLRLADETAVCLH